MQYLRIFCLICGLLCGVGQHAAAGGLSGCPDMPRNGVAVCTDSISGISDDVQMEGIAVINGKVYIDGAPVPRGVSRVTSAKTHKVYRIRTDKHGNVSVEEE